MPYPPGTSASDPRAPWNEPDRSHEHRWRPVEQGPILEDGAAIFREECEYAEGEYGQGWQCEETRYYRFEVAWIEQKRDDKPNIYYLGSELDHFWRKAELALMDAERNGEITAIDSDPDLGYVTVETDDWRVKYKANPEPQIDPQPR